MPISLIWLAFVSLAVLGMIFYDVAIKLAVDKINVFSFTAAMTLFALLGHIAALGLYKYFNPETDLKVGTYGITLALLGAAGILMMDIGFFMGVKYGGLIRTNTVWLIAGLVITAIISLLAFHEQLTSLKLLGIALGVVSVILLAAE